MCQSKHPTITHKELILCFSNHYSRCNRCLKENLYLTAPYPAARAQNTPPSLSPTTDHILTQLSVKIVNLYRPDQDMDLEEECCGDYHSPPPPSALEQWVPSSSDNENLLLDPEMDVKTIFASPNVVSAFAHENSEIVLKLVTPESIAEIMELFRTTPEKSLLRTIFQLFMSTNKALLQALSEVSAGIDGLAGILRLEGEGDLYRIGLATQILTTCVKMWPGDVFEMMTKSPVLFPAILESLGKDSVLHCAIALAQTPPSWFHTFLWGFLNAYVAGRIRLPPKPRSWNVNFPGIENCERVELNSLQRQRVLQVICAFLVAFPDETDFKEVMMKMIPFMVSASHIHAEMVQLFELGMLLPSSPRLVERALDIIDDRVEHHLLTEKALDYLTYAYDGERIEPVVNFLFRILSPEMLTHVNQFVLRAATKLVARMMEIAPYPRFFAKVTQHLIAYVWNRTTCESLLFRSVVLEIGTIVGDTPSWDGWKQFEREVIEPFMLKNRANRSVKISEENWDKLLVEKLMIQSSVIEMTAADRRPVYDNISDDDLSDSRSAESGSYETNPSEISDSDVIALPKIKDVAPRKIVGSMRMDRISPPLLVGDSEEEDGDRTFSPRAMPRQLGPMSLPLGPQAPPPEIAGDLKPPQSRVRINTGSVTNCPSPRTRRRAKSMAHREIDDEKKKKDCTVA